MNTPLQIQPHTRLQRVRASLKKSLRDGTVGNVLLLLTKNDARFVLQMVDDALAEAETDQAVQAD